jgi:hypothetical protein
MRSLLSEDVITAASSYLHNHQKPINIKKQHNYTIKLNYTNKMTKRKKKQREKQENGLIFSPKRSSQHLQPNK